MRRTLLRAKRLCRVEARGAPGWKDTCDHGDKKEQDGSRHEHRRIECGGFVEHATHDARGGYADGETETEAEERRTYSIRQRELQDLGPLRAERDADPDLAGALRCDP